MLKFDSAVAFAERSTQELDLAWKKKLIARDVSGDLIFPSKEVSVLRNAQTAVSFEKKKKSCSIESECKTDGNRVDMIVAILSLMGIRTR